jgi:hypothetical protein
MKNRLLYFILFLSIIACSNSSFHENETKKEHSLSNISIPPTLTPYNDSAQNLRHAEKEPTIITLVGAGCNICIVELNSWKKLIENGHLDKEWNYYFIALGKPNFYFNENILRKTYLKRLPIFLDQDSTFLKENGIGTNYWRNYKTLVLNKTDSLLHIGSPNSNKKNLEIINSQLK